MQVWDGVTGSRISFDWPSVGGNAQRTSDQKIIAFMTENLNLTSSLLARLDELRGVSIFDNSRVEDISYGSETDALDLSSWPVVEMAGGRRLITRLLVGADGANSPVRTFAGIGSRGWDYYKHGLVATVQLEGEGWGRNGEKTAYQRFLPTGPVALLPVCAGDFHYSNKNKLTNRVASRQPLHTRLVYHNCECRASQNPLHLGPGRHGQRRLSSFPSGPCILTHPTERPIGRSGMARKPYFLQYRADSSTHC